MFTFALLKNPCWVYRWFGSIKVQIEVIAQFVSNDMIVGERGRKINRLSVTQRNIEKSVELQKVKIESQRERERERERDTDTKTDKERERERERLM